MSNKEIIDKLDRIFFNTLSGAGASFNNTTVANHVVRGHILATQTVWEDVAPDIPTGQRVSFPTVVSKIKLASTSALDTIAAGTGAQLALVFGLDQYYKEQQEVIALTGQVPASSNLEYLRINRFIIIQCGSLGFNQGTIYISNDTDTWDTGVPENIIYSAMPIDTNSGATSFYTVPAGDISNYLTGMNIASDTTPGKEVILEVLVRPFGLGCFSVGGSLPLSGGVNYYPLSNIYSIPPKSDVYLRCKKTAGTSVHLSIHLYILRKLK